MADQGENFYSGLEEGVDSYEGPAEVYQLPDGAVDQFAQQIAQRTQETQAAQEAAEEPFRALVGDFPELARTGRRARARRGSQPCRQRGRPPGTDGRPGLAACRPRGHDPRHSPGIEPKRDGNDAGARGGDPRRSPSARGSASWHAAAYPF